MTRVLLVGQQPETIDYTDPALPAGLSAEKIHAALAAALNQLVERGWKADLCLFLPDESAGPSVARQLAAEEYDCVMVGFGVRLPPRNLLMFEAVVNAVHRAAPGAAIAFNTRPDDSAEAVGRWIRTG
jgi:hypothetical protein